jgi:hypothetical protein
MKSGEKSYPEEQLDEAALVPTQGGKLTET